MKGAGLPGLELLALNLVREGKYTASTLGFRGCEFTIVQAPMPPGFEAVYDDCARQWTDMGKDLRIFGAGVRRVARGRLDDDDEGEDHDAQEEARAMTKLRSIYWGFHQRFFRSLYVAAKVPFLIQEARKAVGGGNAVIIGLQYTGESQIAERTLRKREQQQRRIDEANAVIAGGGGGGGGAAAAADGAEAKEEDDGEVSQAYGIMERFLSVHVPVELEGMDVVRDRHLAWLNANRHRLPGNPLDMLIDGLGGPERVAELTGRGLRKDKDGRHKKHTVDQRTHERERTAFQQGIKSVAVISEAASTGISLHADRREPSAHKRRVHFCLELAWGADQVMQQLGRSHRSNQETGPIYKFLVSEKMGADMRFVSTVARRLQTLGT